MVSDHDRYAWYHYIVTKLDTRMTTDYIQWYHISVSKSAACGDSCIAVDSHAIVV